MRIEQVAIPLTRAVVRRPRLAAALFRLDRWGNPFAPERYSWPYPTYERIRADGPVVHRRLYQQHFVTGHAEGQELLASPHTTNFEQQRLLLSVRPYTRLDDGARRFVEHFLIFTDPPDHTRLRRLVSRAFTPRQVSRIEDAVGRLAAQRVDVMWDRSDTDGWVDAVGGLALPLPINVICELLGVPEDRWAWVAEVSGRLSTIGNVMEGFDPEDVNDALADMRRYFVALGEQRRRDPRDDLVTALATVDDDGDGLTEDEFVAMIGLLVFAGHETTSGLIANSLIALARHPDQLELIRDRPELWDNAVEELLRWDPPVQTDARTTTADIELGGVGIPAGRNITIFLGACNRDPRRYDAPGELRLDRTDPQPLSFGHGIHFCLGHALARMETKAALSAFVDRFGPYRIDEAGLVWKSSLVTRGPLVLPVRPR